MSEIIIDGQRFEGYIQSINREMDFNTEKITLEIILIENDRRIFMNGGFINRSDMSWLSKRFDSSSDKKKQYKGIKFYREKIK